MTIETLAKLFNGSFEYRDEISDFELKELFRTLKNAGVSKSRRKDKVLDTLVKLEELPERPKFTVSADEKLAFLKRLEKLLTGKGSKYREDWSDITKEKLSQFKINKVMFGRIFAALDKKEKRPTKDKTEREQVKKFWVPTRTRVGQEQYRGREIVRSVPYPSNSSLRIIEFIGGGTIVGSASDISSDPELIASRMRMYKFGDKHTVVIEVDETEPGSKYFESLLYSDQFGRITAEKVIVENHGINWIWYTEFEIQFDQFDNKTKILDHYRIHKSDKNHPENTIGIDKLDKESREIVDSLIESFERNNR